MTDTTTATPKLPPAWFKHAFWRVHRLLCRLSGGRFLWTPASKRGWGALRLITIGRKSGQPRAVIIGYIEDGPNLVTMAMNGWDEGHPAWWLNLEANPDATVKLARKAPRPVRARSASRDERDRLWKRWAETDTGLEQDRLTDVAVMPKLVIPKWCRTGRTLEVAARVRPLLLRRRAWEARGDDCADWPALRWFERDDRDGPWPRVITT